MTKQRIKGNTQNYDAFIIIQKQNNKLNWSNNW